MIDRRHLILGGLGLIAAAGRAQPGPNPPGPAAGRAGGAAPGAAVPGGLPGGPGNTGSRLSSGGNSSATQHAARANAPQPPRIEALVLSQSYPGTRLALANAGRDAGLLAASFRRLRFERVTSHHDGGVEATLARIADYLRTVDADTIALVYVAGHGVEIGGENLLVLEGGASFLSLQALVQALQERAGVTILFLDACRNNPFAGTAPAGGRVSRALAGEDGVRLQTVSLDDVRAASSGAPGRLRAFALQGSGIKIVFSTEPGNVALDAVRPGSRNGPFAQALARRIRESASLDDIVALATGDVIRATRRAQSPWSQGSIDRPIFLTGRRRRAQTSFR